MSQFSGNLITLELNICKAEEDESRLIDFCEFPFPV
jgi:hypothetical protein